MIDPPPLSSQRVLEVVKVFLRFGLTAFGGPSAHISMYHDELVKRRRWLSEQHFLDLLGATNLIPGPNSTEMAIHLSWVRAGLPGMLLGGICFITPSMIMVIALAWAYSQYGSKPQAGWIMYGIQPIVIAIILQALIDLGRKVINTLAISLVSLIASILYFLNISPVLILILCGILVLVWQNIHRVKAFRPNHLPIIITPSQIIEWIHRINWSHLAVITSQPFSFAVLFFTFLKIGAVLYGSGYVLLAFLNADFVNRLGWLTEQQILDAVAVGQITPGPVLSSATFIGFILGGLPGAIIATIGIFLPSFIFVAFSNPLIPRIRNSPWAKSFLDGVIVASLGLMAAVIFQLGQVSFPDIFTGVICATAFILLVKYRVNTTWLILGGLFIGLIAGNIHST